MKKFLIIVLLLCVVIVGGLITLVAMSFNPSSYEKQVITSLGQLTGRTISIGPGTNVVWNPVPTITLHDVRMSNINKATSPDMLTIEQVKITIAWSSLLKTPFEIKSIELSKPVLSLERLENSQANFDFEFLTNPNFQSQSLDLLSDNSQPTSTRIEKIVVKEGQIAYQNNLTGVHLTADNINGTLSANSVRGPFTFKGTTLMGGKTLSVQGNTAVFQAVNPIETNFKVEEKSLGAAFTLAGEYTPTRADQWFEGSLQFSVKDVNPFIEFLGLNLPKLAADKPIAGSASVITSSNTDTLKNFVFTLGEGEGSSALTGTIIRTLQGTTPSYHLEIAADTLNLADFPEYRQKLNWEILTQTDTPQTTFNVQIKSLPIAKATLQNVVLKGNLKAGKLALEQADALFPGQTLIKSTGSAAVSAKVPTLTLSVQGSTEKLKEFSKWAFPSQELSANSVKKAEFSGQITLTPQKTTYQIQSAKLDDSLVSGQIALTTGDKPVAQIKLVANNLNIDKLTNWQAPKNTTALGDFPLTLKHALEGASWLNEKQIQGSLDLTDSTVFGLPITKAYLEGNLQDSILTLDKIDIQNVATTNLTGTLKLNGVGRPQLNVDQLNLALESQQLPLLLQRAHITSSLPLIEKSAQASARLTVSGGRNGVWQTNLQAALSDATIKLSGQFTGLETNLRADNLTFEVAHPNFQNLMRGIDANWTYLPKLDGSFQAKGKLTGSADHLAFQDTQLTIGLQKLSGNLNYDKQAHKNITATLSSPSFDLNRFIGSLNYSTKDDLSKKKFDFTAWNDWKADLTLSTNQLLYQDLNIRNAEVNLVLNEKELSLNHLTGQNGDNTDSPIDLSAKLNWSDTPNFTANFKAQKLPLRSDFMVLPEIAFGTGTLSLSGEMKAHGDSLAAFMQSLNGKGSIAFQNTQIIGVNITQMLPVMTRAIQRSETAKEFEPEFNRILHGGKTPVQEISGDFAIADGIIRMMDLTLKTTEATANPTQIVWDLPKGTLDISIPVVMNTLTNLPPFILGISVNEKGATYQPSFTDLSSVLSNQSQHALADTLKQQQEAATQAAVKKRSDRVSEAKETTQQARTALAEMDQLFKSFPFETGNRLLQSARDAMALVNQLSVLEEPTDAQLIQQIEQSRLVLLKAQEFRTALEQETAFNTQKKITDIQAQADTEVAALQQWATEHPDISLLAKLAQNAAQNRIIIEQMAMALKKELSAEQVEKALAVSAEALAKIDKAYQHAARFDFSQSGATSAQPAAQADQSATGTGIKKEMRGSFNRRK